MAALSGHYKLAETIYLEQGQTDAAMTMYQTLHKWDEAIIVAEARNHPNLDEMRTNYSQWLTETGQEEKAGEMREVRSGGASLAFCISISLGAAVAFFELTHTAQSCGGSVLLLCLSLRSTVGNTFATSSASSSLSCRLKATCRGRLLTT